MKVRTLEELEDALTEQLAWRQKELRTLRLEVLSSRSVSRRTIERSAIALSYAHLEGFFKESATTYMQFVAGRTVNLEQLAESFQAVCVTQGLRRKFHGSIPPDPVQFAHEVLVFVEASRGTTAKLSHEKEIRTNSNLNSDVLRALLRRVGIREDLFALREKPLDEGLLRVRNHVAHGQRIPVETEEVVAWIDMVLDMCTLFRAELANAAVLGRWKRAS